MILQSLYVALFTLLVIASNAFQFLDEALLEGDAAMSESMADTPWLQTAVSKWMGDLPDTTKLNLISIPGAHDAGARRNTIWYCRTQSLTLTQQLTHGIRYFDIRLRRVGRSFAIYHGSCSMYLSFGEVLDEMRAFLKANPSETVLMRVKEEFIPLDGSKPFADIWDSYMKWYGDLFVAGQAGIPILRSIRGKILVLRQADIRTPYQGIDYSGKYTDIQDEYRVTLFPFSIDVYISIIKKRSLIAEYIDEASESSKIVLNHVSAIGLVPWPLTMAKLTNPHAYKHIGLYTGAKRVGVLIMDFPGPKLIYSIIRTNFQSNFNRTRNAHP